MSIGSMNGIRRTFAFKASIRPAARLRRASSQSASWPQSCAIISRGVAARPRAKASRTVRLTEMFAGEPKSNSRPGAVPRLRFSQLSLGESAFEIVQNRSTIHRD